MSDEKFRYMARVLWVDRKSDEASLVADIGDMTTYFNVSISMMPFEVHKNQNIYVIGFTDEHNNKDVKFEEIQPVELDEESIFMLSNLHYIK